MTVFMAPTGNIIRGHVLDCAQKPLEEKLKQYDEYLYLKWNPKKLWGWGCWELRRAPENKQVVNTYKLGNTAYLLIDRKEIDIVNHVCDIPFLNYSLLEKVKKMDTWQQSYKAKDWASNYEYEEAKYKEKVDEKYTQDLRYNLKQLKSEMRDLQAHVLSGRSLADLASHWGKKGS